MSVNTDNNISILQEEPTTCQTIVHETVCVQGTVTITPSVVSGESTSFCVGNPIIGSCPGELADNCVFSVSQNICVQIPLTFSATASAVEDGIVCGAADIGSCAGTAGCTRTIGFYRNNPEVTNAIIANAGGSIVLGINGNGLSFTVTATNANDVLDFDTPSPPAPSGPPLAQQYKNLYAQLLAADLNVLALEAQDVEICDFALEAIAAANNFLATSPAGGTTGAPGFQEDLERFNSGNVPGCPIHCED